MGADAVQGRHTSAHVWNVSPSNAPQTLEETMWCLRKEPFNYTAGGKNTFQGTRTQLVRVSRTGRWSAEQEPDEPPPGRELTRDTPQSLCLKNSLVEFSVHARGWAMKKRFHYVIQEKGETVEDKSRRKKREETWRIIGKSNQIKQLHQFSYCVMECPSAARMLITLFTNDISTLFSSKCIKTLHPLPVFFSSSTLVLLRTSHPSASRVKRNMGFTDIPFWKWIFQIRF